MEFVIVLIVIIWAATYAWKNYIWSREPTMEQYLSLHPECKTDRGIQCTHCNSMSIRNWGQRGANDNRRLFSCNHCGIILYRN